MITEEQGLLLVAEVARCSTVCQILQGHKVAMAETNGPETIQLFCQSADQAVDLLAVAAQLDCRPSSFMRLLSLLHAVQNWCCRALPGTCKYFVASFCSPFQCVLS